MNVVEPGSAGENLIARSKELILRPLPTWDVIDAEDTTIEGVYRSWAIPLAAIPAVCGAVGQIAFSSRVQIFGVHFHPSIVGVLSRSLVTYALSLGCVYVMALVVDGLALRFGGERSRTQAFKLAAYSATPGWIAGLFALLPGLGGLFGLLGGLYSLYLFYLGLPKLMRSDPDETLGYFGLCLLVLIGLAIVVGALSSCFGGWGGPVSIY